MEFNKFFTHGFVIITPVSIHSLLCILSSYFHLKFYDKNQYIHGINGNTVFLLSHIV